MRVDYVLSESGGPVPRILCDHCGGPIEEAVGASRVYVERQAYCVHDPCFARFVNANPGASNAGSLEAFLAALVVQTTNNQPKPFMQKLLYTAGYDADRSEELAKEIVDELTARSFRPF